MTFEQRAVAHERQQTWPDEDINSRPRKTMSAFAVAIGGKADIAFCSAYVCL
jgi:hypothetical protein